jgi:hypothetical protein
MVIAIADGRRRQTCGHGRQEILVSGATDFPAAVKRLPWDVGGQC